MLKVEDDVTTIDSKGGGGYEDVNFLKNSVRYYCVHEETSYYY